MANCYSLHLGAININYSDAPSEDVNQVGHNVTCCVRGSTCMSNGIYKNSNSDRQYTADYTDPTLQDPSYQNHYSHDRNISYKHKHVFGLFILILIFDKLAPGLLQE
ncbi:hypothetical protein N7448_008688 [Penicillium atrosanguineum]|nr:hypothetical protein N7448_008688 [Penicillium atrosanguineum]